MKKCIGILALFLQVLTSPARAQERPNFVFIYTDDQRWDAMSVVQREQGDKARFPWLATPNMDRLAAEGVRFRNAFVVNSLCSPSRASFLTGCYGYLNGIVNNHTPFDANNVTHASLLRAAGYKTGYVGKWHMGPQRGQRPGFDYSASFIGQGRYVDCPVEINGKSTATKGWVDDVCTDFGIQFMKDNREKPFLLVVGFKATHGPFTPPARRKDAYAGESARSVPNLGVAAGYKEGGAARPAAVQPGGKVPTNLNYFRCISAADDNLGRILQTIDDLKLSSKTVVVFASDNGYYLGEHGLGDKRSAYEESMRIPLIVRYPGKVAPGKTRDDLVLNVDLAPTFLDYAGVAIPNQMQGRSWRPLLEGKPADWRRAFFYAYFYENPFAIPTVTAVRTQNAKLIKYPGHDDWTELFDLERDPYEIKNLVHDPGATELRKELEAEYERQKTAIAFRIPPFADVAAPDGSRQPLKAWVLDYRFNHDEGDKVKDRSGKDNHGVAHGTALVAGRNGGRARQFDGKSHIDVPKTASLNPAVPGWSIEVSLKADEPSGVLVARGGGSNGYCLYLDKGYPVFAVNTRGRASSIRSKQKVANNWTTVGARITANKQLVLSIDGTEVGRAPLAEFIPRDPADGMQIGADLGNQVVSERPPRFVGLIESVRIYSGDNPPR